uniref:DNA pilot protein n=1 Tax=Geladintestivirus 5 TaxID=3233137 RepID=A0AAU8MGZ1_9CAUD
MRISLKRGDRSRKKALFGADGAVIAAATLAAAGMNVGATLSSASTQAKAVQESAKTQAQAIKDQTKNNNALQQESMNFTRQQNRENRDQQQEIQTTLQMMAGQENMNDRFEATKVAVKYGGRPKKLKSIQPSSYREGNRPFTVTDGGGVIPLQTDANGYGLYELYGNDHNHYHKTSSGKQKSGVGIKFKDGSIVEGEGNQNTNNGEKLLVTPNDAMFISKHSIAGFNPSQAVDMGMNPQEAFNIQQVLKLIKGINDDGSRMNPTRRKQALAGMDIINAVNQTQYPQNGTVDVATGAAYATQNMTQQTIANTTDPKVANTTDPKVAIAKCGGYRKLKCGGRKKAKGGYWQNYGGATYAGIGNVVGAGMNTFGNYFAGNMLGKAYTEAGNILAEAYDQMHGIDLSELNREDYSPGHVMAVVRSANTNINPQLERLRRNADKERRVVNANTLSSAVRQQRLAGINDRMYQRMGEQFTYKHNEDEKIKQDNAARIQEASAQNAQLDATARQAYGNARMSLLQYNNNIENAKIAGKAQSLAEGITQSNMARSNAMINSTNAFSAAITGTAQGFANAYTANQKAERDYQNVLIGADTEAKVNALIMRGDRQTAKNLYDSFIESNNENYKKYAQQLDAKFGFSGTQNGGITYIPSTRQKLATVFPNNPNYKPVSATTSFAAATPIKSVVWNPDYNWENDWYSLYNVRK